MDKELVAHIVELVKMELRNSADADVASSATGMLRLELVVHQCLMEMGRQVVQDMAQQAGTGYQGRRVKRGKVVFSVQGESRQDGARAVWAGHGGARLLLRQR